MTTQQTTVKFSELGIAPKILGILGYHKYTEPTPIQHQAIPPAMEGKDLIGIAQTGTGKTLAFGIPMIQRLGTEARGQGLVLVPTRELALQVNETLTKIGAGLGLRTSVLIGGAPMGPQIKSLYKKPHIIVATPGRLDDHLRQRTLNLNQVKIVVLDEADRMLDIGFAKQIKDILSLISTDRQTMLFSATMSADVARLASHYQKLPLRIEVAPAGTTASQVEQEVFIINKDMKMKLLDKVLTENTGSVLVFSRTKHGAKRIVNTLRDMGYSTQEIHSNRSLSQRVDALEGFKSGRYRILVATDIAARGIDVKGISLVVNYDLPDDLENYVHRIGRTGRAGETGKAITFATREERSDLRSIERLIRKTLPILEVPFLLGRKIDKKNENTQVPIQKSRIEHTDRGNKKSSRWNSYPKRNGRQNSNNRFRKNKRHHT